MTETEFQATVTDSSGLSGTFWVSASKVPCPGKPLCLGPTGTVGHPISDTAQARGEGHDPRSHIDQGLNPAPTTDPVTLGTGTLQASISLFPEKWG